MHGTFKKPDVPVDATSVLLLKAAELIEKKGHCKGKLQDQDGSMCIFGALNTAVVEDDNLELENLDLCCIDVAAIRVMRLIGLKKDKLNDLVVWNDSYGRTKEEVVATLRAAAGQLS